MARTKAEAVGHAHPAVGLGVGKNELPVADFLRITDGNTLFSASPFDLGPSLTNVVPPEIEKPRGGLVVPQRNSEPAIRVRGDSLRTRDGPASPQARVSVRIAHGRASP